LGEFARVCVVGRDRSRRRSVAGFPVSRLATDSAICSEHPKDRASQNLRRQSRPRGSTERRIWAHQRLPRCTFPHGPSLKAQVTPSRTGTGQDRGPDRTDRTGRRRQDSDPRERRGSRSSSGTPRQRPVVVGCLRRSQTRAVHPDWAAMDGHGDGQHAGQRTGAHFLDGPGQPPKR
jgi:hypothetical protein